MVTSKRYNETYNDVAHTWDLTTLLDALEVLECLEAMEQEELNNAKRK